MGLFNRSKKDLATEGIPGTAVIVTEDHFEGEAFGLTDVGLGSYKFKFELEVTLTDGRPPYTVAGKFKVPAAVGGQSGPGVALPIAADPDNPKRIEIDWDQFLADGGAAKFEEAFAKKREARTREVVAANQPNTDKMLDDMVASGLISPAGAERQKKMNALQASGITPPDDASPRQMFDWQLANGVMDQATYDAIIANNPELE
jgi:hypothetical protein